MAAGLADTDEIEIEVSMVEVYNEIIRDLLADDYAKPKVGGLKLLENEKERIKISDVTSRKPMSADEVMDLVVLGNTRRSTSPTAANAESSRSHAVLQINVTRRSRNHEVDVEAENVERPTSFATLSIIDLAGSEKAAATTNMGARMKEGQNINKSLLQLSNCIEALCQEAKTGRKGFIPYRNSKLTRMLKFSLGGNCRTVMIVCVSPSSKDLEDTSNTLMWANKAKNVKTQVSRNTAGQHVSARQYLSTINQQQIRIKWLEGELEKLNNPDPSKPGSTTWSQQKRDAAKQEADRFMAGVKVEMTNAMGKVTAGATQRAMWDTAEIRIAALRAQLFQVEMNATSRPAEDVARHKEIIQSLIRQQEAAFSKNPQVALAVQQEANAIAPLTRILKANEERTLGESIDTSELVSFRLGIAAHRADLEKSITSAREKGYREAIQALSEAFAQVVSLAHDWSTTVQEESDLLSGLSQTVQGGAELVSTANRMNDFQTSMLTQLAGIFGKSALASPPPLPTTMQSQPSSTVAQIAMMSPARPHAAPKVRSLGAPSHGTPRKGAVSAFHANPAARRLLAFAGPYSPAKSGRTAPASPLRSVMRRNTQHRVGHVKGRTPKKTARWKDETGGRLDDRSTALDALVFSSPSEASGPEQGALGVDEAEEETEEEETPPRPKPAISLPKSNLPKPISPSNPFYSSLTSTTNAAASSSSTSPTNIPEWKKNRMLMGKSKLSRLSTLGEERESSVSPNRSSSIKPPSASASGSRVSTRGPLSERSDNSPPAAESTVNTSSVFANLARPTASSLSRAAAGLGSVPKMGPPSRRISSIGPQKANRRASTASSGPYASTAIARRSRGSIIPGTSRMGDASMSMGIEGLPVPSSGSASMSVSMTAGPSSMFGGAQRRLTTALPVPLTASSPVSGISPPGANRRSSFMPPPPSLSSFGPPISNNGSRLGAGPRASLSMAQLPKVGMSSLSSRPSMSALRGAPSSSNVGVAGAGDTSTRGPWR